MSDQEFDVLDELYFVQSFEEIKEATGLKDETLEQVLRVLIDKGWIRCMESRDGEPGRGEMDFPNQYMLYYYLATKKGLLAHNSR